MGLRWLVLVMLLLRGGAAYAGEPYAAGMRAMTAEAPVRGARIGVTLWYPAATGGTAQSIGATPVFEGTAGYPDAAMAPGRFPLVLLAHGGLRAAPVLGNWIAAALARRGMIVAVVQAPPPGRLRAAEAARALWLRPADMSAALTALERDPQVAAHAAPGAVGAVGFLRGGTSVLALAGARIDAGRYMASCDTPEGPDCAWFAQAGVSLHDLDPRLVAQSHRDPRVRTVVAVAPELAGEFSAASLRAVAVPVAVIQLGPAGSQPPWMRSAGLAAAIPGARQARVADASLFSSFSRCTRAAPAILAEDGGEAICRDGGGRSRAAIHADLAERIAAALEAGLAARRSR